MITGGKCISLVPNGIYRVYIIMHHKRIRTDNQCLNCGHLVEERYCSACGQENLALTESAFYLVLHYFQDLFHYNGKFWHTFKYFIRKPGLVPSEYMKGKRKRFLHPIRFYVFSSTLFFLFLFLLSDVSAPPSEASADIYNKRLNQLEQIKSFLANSPDTVFVNNLVKTLELSLPDTINDEKKTDTDNQLELDLLGPKMDTSSSAHWLEKALGERIIAKTDEMNRVHQGDEKKAVKAFLNKLLHGLPQMFFLSLPFFAFFLHILYNRSTKTYVANFIFSIYSYAYFFIILLFYLFAGWIKDQMVWEHIDQVWEWMIIVIVIYIFIYLYLSLKRFYSDSGWSLIMRYIILLFLFTFIMIILLILMTFLTFIF